VTLIAAGDWPLGRGRKATIQWPHHADRG